MSSASVTQRIEVLLGSGGVGKTTLATAMGLFYAEQGKKTLLMTIDPSARLALALGVPKDLGFHAVPKLSPHLFVATVPHKKVFDDFVIKAAGGQEKAQVLLKNRLYQQLTSDLSGSQDFSSLQHLYSAYIKNEFEVIILDTPPAQHAIEFLRSPKKLGALFDKAIFQWLAQMKRPNLGFISRLVELGTRQALKAVELLTGSEFVRELFEFFTSIESWRERLQKRTVEISELLQGPQTHFSLVTVMDKIKLEEAKDIAATLNSEHFKVRRVFANRSSPYWWPLLGANEKVSIETKPDFSVIESYFREKLTNLEHLRKHFDSQLEVIDVPEVHPNSDSIAEIAEIKNHFISRGFL